MGQPSAKNLRGESMSDVIFNGSAERKPVGQASVELIFDNSQGRVTGEFAAYNEIGIRRKVARDGQSNYYLNGNKCRRRDITDTSPDITHTVFLLSTTSGQLKIHNLLHGTVTRC